jgi:hypothetical protein
LNAISTPIFNNLNRISTSSILGINNLTATSTTLLDYINTISTNTILSSGNINISGTTKLNNNVTCISSLNISGITTLSNNVVIGSGPATNILHVGNAFSTAGVYTNLMNMNMNGIALNKDTTVSGNIKCSGSFGINATSLLSRLTVRMSYSDGNTGGFCIDSADTTNTYNLRIFSYVQAVKLYIIFK